MNPRDGGFIGHSGPEFRGRERAIESLNEFFGDAKRRQIDPTSYSQVGRALLPLHGALAIQSGPLATEYITAPAPSAAVSVGGGGGSGGVGGHGPMAQQYYLPPMANVRTKGDLRDLDHILETMQATVYESANAAAEAGVAQPGSHYTHQAMNFRHSQSPPHHPAHQPHHQHHQPGSVLAEQQAAYSAGGVPAGSVASPLTAVSSAHSTGTPAATPPSSYTSGNSPSSASSSGLSPQSRHSSMSNSVLYPQLPSVTSVMPGQSVPSTIGPTGMDMGPRRYSNNYQQKSSSGARLNGGPTSPSARTADGSTTPRAGSGHESTSPSTVGSPAPTDSDANDEVYEAWLSNVRVIEFIRQYVADRLERGDYDDRSRSPPTDKDAARPAPMPAATDRMDVDDKSDDERDPAPKSLYPPLRML